MSSSAATGSTRQGAPLITYEAQPLAGDDSDYYVNAYAVRDGGSLLGVTYQCISGGWTGAPVEVTSADGTVTYESRSVWATRAAAGASLWVASTEVQQ
jgi:hypothetical protein